jgi:hypothetical protein
MRDMVLMVYWLVTGEPAYDYAPRQVCEAIRYMTQANGDLIELTLDDGSILRATRIECRRIVSVDIGASTD